MSSEITLYANRVALPLIEIFETINSISITVTMVFENTIIFKPISIKYIIISIIVIIVRSRDSKNLYLQSIFYFHFYNYYKFYTTVHFHIFPFPFSYRHIAIYRSILFHNIRMCKSVIFIILFHFRKNRIPW